MENLKKNTREIEQYYDASVSALHLQQLRTHGQLCFIYIPTCFPLLRYFEANPRHHFTYKKFNIYF